MIIDYINQLIIKEESSFSIKVRNFWSKYCCKPSKIHFKIEEEYFYIVLRYKNFAIYFNDIEEVFGICILDKDICTKNAEFYDNLNPTILKLLEIDSDDEKNWFD